MALLGIKAKIECDGCGCKFDLALDAAVSLKDATLYDHVIDSIGDTPLASFQGEHMLCAGCTVRVNAAFGDDDQPSFAQVAAALNKSILGDEGD